MQFSQVIFVAASDSNGWTENLFFIVLVGVWVIGALLKALSRMAGKRQATPEQYPKKPSETAVRPKTLAQMPKKVKIQAPPKAPVVKEKYKLLEQAAVPIKKSFSKEKTPFAKERPSKEEKKKIHISGKGLVKLDSVSDIRRAVVYYEILGKPISLRDYPFYV